MPSRHIGMATPALALLTLLAAGSAVAADRYTLTGTATDASGKPVDHATVIVYSARVRQGYSTFCPTCYTDCGKRTVTAADGSFTVPSLSPDLFFDLLVAREGYLPTFVRKVDPAKPGAAAVLK